MRYKDAGVDIDRQDEFISYIKQKVEGIGHFAGAFFMPSNYREPLLISSADGVGTKIKIAQSLGKHYNVGIDLVAMCVNDVVTTGATPLFFLDYLAFGRIDLDVAEEIVDGMIAGCREAGCVLLGGETAEMPDVYSDGGYDLAGFSVGIVEKDEIITGERIAEGDIIVGLSSSGLHSNGFSLVRKLFSEFTEELLTPTRIYVKDILSIKERIEIHGIAHITGGGLIENIKRILPKGLCAKIELNWQIPEIFSEIKKKGNIEDLEMFRTFNMGIGMCLILSEREDLSALPEHYVIGRIERGKREVKINEESPDR
jgi:phosphoribosylformylglycinamidine cyclo-ligase